MTETRAPGDAPPPNPALRNPDAASPRRTPAGGNRDERLAAALRANLARRKAQGRARTAADAADHAQGCAATDGVEPTGARGAADAAGGAQGRAAATAADDSQDE